jgi:SAM-dependent methyltransferase
MPFGYQTSHPELHPNFKELKAFIEAYALKSKKCLEIGSSGGFFQDMVEDYYGTDIDPSLAQYYHKPYRIAENERYPFDDQMFDAIWTITVFEHIPHLQQALLEIKRLLKPGGVVMFAPAWQCRPWAADGYAVRPYKDFGLKGKLIKASIPFRDSVIWRGLFIFPKRLYRHFRFCLGMCFAKERLYEKNFFQTQSVLWCALSCLACVALSYHLSRIQCLLAPWFVWAVVVMARRIPPVMAALQFIGRYAFPIWLIHSFFCYYYCQKFIFWPKWAPLIFVNLIAISLLASLLLEKARTSLFNLWRTGPQPVL